MIANIVTMTREAIIARALSQIVALPVPPKELRPLDWVRPVPIEYRLDDSGRLGGDDPMAPMCADWSYGYRTPTADCVGFALWAVGIRRRQPGYKGLNDEWLNTDSIIADAEGAMKFFRPVFSGEKARPGDLLVTRSRKTLLRRIPGHVGVIVRPAHPGGKHLVVDCSPRHGRDTAINTGEPWSDLCQVVRPLNILEAA